MFLKLCRHTEIINLPAGSYLFKIGKLHRIVFGLIKHKGFLYLSLSVSAGSDFFSGVLELILFFLFY